MSMTHKALIVGLFLFGCVLVTAEPVIGQRKAIPVREYLDGIYPKPELPWHQRSRRVETVNETLGDGRVTRSETEISEVLLPDRSRQYTKIVEGTKVSEYEEIIIDYMQYTRKDGGSWTTVDLRSRGAGSGSGSGSGSTVMSCTQYTVEAVFLNGMSVKLFERLDIRTVGDELRFAESRNWIGEDGLPYREENVSGRLSPRIEMARETVTFDYNPNIKIEAPVK